ncbi:hypothetical protein HBI25_045830 [Parastagonospora nodorum]|nr:hypothetical protein HBI06_086290 [Parastagonospora nodorum]KAH4245528.1 hypothetical protein HBI05_069420 [Parastagonospora nodorum]KAH4856513.1 hypothetical protein HBH75_074710 [Parastagonospora nodorum]KAH4987835.1 hypothetical protein HBI76_099770 [Parastagonospora nodorum]KAH5023237.1 hypothetical protein HBI74_134770 [Parastagonospora nodorum]
MYGKFIIDFIYPKNERNGMSEGQTFAYPSSSTGNVHTVTVRLEYNDRFQETGGKPIEIWIVYQPKLPAGEIDMDEPDSWNTIKSAVTSGESYFNLGSFKTPISSFASDKEAWDHVQSVLNEKKAELKKDTDVEFDTEIWPDTEQNLSYAVVVGPQDPLIRAAKHVVAMSKMDSK